MTCDLVVHSWVYDWQTLIAGGLAFIGGAGAIVATRMTTAYTKNSERRKIAAQSHAACQLLGAVAREIAARCTTIEGGLKSNWPVPYTEPEVTRIFQVIRKPSLATVWTSLGLVGREAVTKYLQLDIAIESLETEWLPGMTGTQVANVVGNIRLIAHGVVGELASEQKRYSDVLAAKGL